MRLLILQTDSEDFIKDMVGQTSGFMPRDIQALIADAGASLLRSGNFSIDSVESGDLNRCLRFQPEPGSVLAPQASGIEILTKALERSKKRNASALGTPKVSRGVKLTACFPCKQ